MAAEPFNIHYTNPKMPMHWDRSFACKDATHGNSRTSPKSVTCKTCALSVFALERYWKRIGDDFRRDMKTAEEIEADYAQRMKDTHARRIKSIWKRIERDTALLEELSGG